MANGETFKELREMVESERDIPLKVGMRLLMASVADMHESDAKYRKEITDAMGKMVTREEFSLVRAIVYTACGAVLLAFFGVIISFFIREQPIAAAEPAIVSVQADSSLSSTEAPRVDGLVDDLLNDPGVTGEVRDRVETLLDALGISVLP